MKNLTIQEDLQQFTSTMLMYRPFFGDILLRLPILPDDSIPTACTDGRTIRWNPAFFSTLDSAQRHYVLMHEVLHTLLMHPSRMQGRDWRIWNVAADMVVNSMCDQIASDVNALSVGSLMRRPPDGIFAAIPYQATAESLYGILQADLERHGKNKASVKKDYRPGAFHGKERMEITIDDDLRPAGAGGGQKLTPAQQKLLEQEIRGLLRNAAGKERGAFGSYYVPKELVQLTKPRPVNWRQMLKDHLTETISDDASYATPERKYLHMDLILPGYCLSEGGELETLWAFVDSSGSIDSETLNQFLTQLHRIVKEFRCELNICYWDTEVTDVYRRVRTEKQVLKCQPHHSGGTDINCVFAWMTENRVKPDVMLILTDGYFGSVSPANRRCLRPRDTILVLSNDTHNPEYAKIGRICRLM